MMGCRLLTINHMPFFCDRSTFSKRILDSQKNPFGAVDKVENNFHEFYGFKNGGSTLELSVYFTSYTYGRFMPPRHKRYFVDLTDQKVPTSSQLHWFPKTWELLLEATQIAGSSATSPKKPERKINFVSAVSEPSRASNTMFTNKELRREVALRLKGTPSWMRSRLRTQVLA